MTNRLPLLPPTRGVADVGRDTGVGAGKALTGSCAFGLAPMAELGRGMTGGGSRKTLTLGTTTGRETGAGIGCPRSADKR